MVIFCKYLLGIIQKDKKPYFCLVKGTSSDAHILSNYIFYFSVISSFPAVACLHICLSLSEAMLQVWLLHLQH